MTRAMTGAPGLVAFVAAGCVAVVPGTSHPVPSTTTTPSQTIDPCALLTDADVHQFGLLPSGRDTAAGGRDCNWRKTGQYALGVEIFDHERLDQLGTFGRTITRYPVGSHDGRQVSSQDGCGVYLQLAQQSVVVIAVVDGRDALLSCPLADQYATLVESKLPV